MDARIISAVSFRLPRASRPRAFSEPLNLNLASQVLAFLLRLVATCLIGSTFGHEGTVVVIPELVTALSNRQISTWMLLLGLKLTKLFITD
jgi:hypothetical protein